jgi:hypothetical protein
VNGADHFIAAKRRDHPLDLPPVAEARDIAEVAAALGARRRRETRGVALAFDQIGRVSQREAPMDERTVHARSLMQLPFPDCRQMSSILR